MLFSEKNTIFIGMNEHLLSFAEQAGRKNLFITPPARELLESKRNEIFAETGVLKPRYELASEAIIQAYGKRGDEV
ncbi:hypothetical protein R83H12_00657 [Fibrobacteria bacterium R8-3-H12]